ncbi:MAG: hypothetical protein Q8P57_01225 [Candidatus Pacearchaeota archaeon]|nr:hypothetical protein [Candidatus Pacearchaeota archaeon]
MKTFIILLKIFLIAALLIISNGNLALSNSDNRAVFFESYSVWLGELVEKGVTVTGYVVGTEWLPGKDFGILPD